MEQLELEFPDLCKNNILSKCDVFFRDSQPEAGPTNEELSKFQEKVKRVSPKSYLNCYAETFNGKLILGFSLDYNGKYKNFYYTAFPSLLNSSDNDLLLLLRFVLKENTKTELSRLREVIRRYAFYPRCRCYLKPHYTQGQVYDVQQIFSHLNHTFLEGKLESPIYWRKFDTPFKRRLKRFRFSINRVKSIRLGTYCPRCNSVFINSVLDRNDISYLIVENIVYHEMVHSYVFNFVPYAVFPHGKEFKSLYYRLPKAKEVRKFISSPYFFEKLKEIYLENIGQCQY